VTRRRRFETEGRATEPAPGRTRATINEASRRTAPARRPRTNSQTPNAGRSSCTSAAVATVRHRQSWRVRPGRCQYLLRSRKARPTERGHRQRAGEHTPAHDHERTEPTAPARTLTHGETSGDRQQQRSKTQSNSQTPDAGKKLEMHDRCGGKGQAQQSFQRVRERTRATVGRAKRQRLKPNVPVTSPAVRSRAGGKQRRSGSRRNGEQWATASNKCQHDPVHSDPDGGRGSSSARSDFAGAVGQCKVRTSLPGIADRTGANSSADDDSRGLTPTSGNIAGGSDYGLASKNSADQEATNGAQKVGGDSSSKPVPLPERSPDQSDHASSSRSVRPDRAATEALTLRNPARARARAGNGERDGHATTEPPESSPCSRRHAIASSTVARADQGASSLGGRGMADRDRRGRGGPARDRESEGYDGL